MNKYRLISAFVLTVALVAFLIAQFSVRKEETPVAEPALVGQAQAEPVHGEPGQKEAGKATPESSAAQSGEKAPVGSRWKKKPLARKEMTSVVSVSLADRQVVRENKPIVITFSAPMVEKQDVNKAVRAEDMPFTLEPFVEGEGRWVTQTSFAFLASTGYQRGKEYVLAFPEDLRSLDDKPVRYLFSFRTESTQVRQISPGSYTAAQFEQALNLDFSMRVSRAAVMEHLVVSDAETGEELRYELPPDLREASYYPLRVQLGKYRPKLRIAIRPDKDDDTSLLGFDKEYASIVILPSEDGTRTAHVEAGAENEPSDVHFDYLYRHEERDGNISMTFYLNKSLASQTQKEFIRISPNLPYTLGEDNFSIILKEGLEPGQVVSVTLLPGLTDAGGRVLKEELTRTETVEDRSPAAHFSDMGHYLSPALGGRLGVNLVNVDQITVQLYRQYDNNLPFMDLNPSWHAADMMRDMGFKEIKLKKANKNEMLRRALDVEDLTKGKKGVFKILLRAYKERQRDNGRLYMDYQGSDERLVVISDIGVTARVFPTGITVFASSISSGEALPGAAINVYSASNQLIAQGVAGQDGVFVHKRNDSWDPQLQPSVVTVRSGEGANADLTFLPLSDRTSAALEDQGDRPYLSSGYEAIVYTPRGVFRPGEKVDIKTFVRDVNHLPPAPFPVLFTVNSSRGLEMARGSATLSPQGGADFSFTLPSSAPTGDYFAQLSLPGQKNSALGSCSFSVEDFVPPRLEVAVNPKVEIARAGEALQVELSGQYLFGAPGADLEYELGYKATPKNFNPQGYAGYVFGDGERKFDSQLNLKYLTGKLEANGKKEASLHFPSEWQPPALINILLIGNVREDGGRWVAQTDTLTYFPTPYLLGLKIADGGVKVNVANVISVAAVDFAGKQADSGPLTAEISLIQGNWHTVYRNGRTVYDWSERIIPQESMAVPVKEGKGELRFTPRRYGRYLVRVATKDGGIVASRRLDVWDSEAEGMPEGSGRMHTVDLSFDKQEYRVGDIAHLAVKAPYAGTLFIGVERGEQLFTRVISMNTPAATVDIPVTEGMDPNVSVTAWVMRPVKEENKEWYAHRACGLIALKLAKAPHTLEVSAELPKRASPSAPLTIPFRVADEQGAPVEGEFSVAFIDEGILSLTAYKTPQPVDYFMAQRLAVGSSHDAFDSLLRPEARATTLLKPGGDGGADYQGSLSTQQIFLTAYLPTVRTDANGQGEAAFDIPEYSGKGRLMIVGASKDRFASFAGQVRVARDLVLEASAPRAVAPGDSFELALKLFTLAPEEGNAPTGTADIRVMAEGPLALSGDVSKSVSLKADPGKSAVSHSLTVTAKAGQESGIAKIRIYVESPGRPDLRFEKNCEVVVRPPYPRGSVVKTALLKPGTQEEMRISGKWLPGSVKASFSVDRSPVMTILPSLQYLWEYPYGCLEQTTSRAWPYLSMAQIQKMQYPDKDADSTAKAILTHTIARISSMQTAEGGFALWPGYTSPDPWKSVNATFFLLEAKSRAPVSPATMERALGYLRFLLAVPAEHLGHGAAYAYSTKAYAAFVLTRAGEAPLGWLQTLTEHEGKMFPSGRLFLAGAKALKAGNPNALIALDEKKLLLGSANKDVLGYNPSLESNLRNQSLRLYLWTLLAPEDKQTVKLCLNVAELLSKQTWFITQDAGMAALALGSYLEKTGEKPSAYKVDVRSSGALLAQALKGERLLLAGDALPLDKGAAPVLNLSVEGEGSAYCVYTVRGVPMEPPAPFSSDLAIQRIWKDSSGNVIDLSSGTARLKKGERVFVELTLKPANPVSDMVLSDLLPGGLEVENPRLVTSSAGAAEESNTGAGLYIDQREDRLLVFFDQLSGEVTYKYSMRAVSRGDFVLPPLAAEGMYAPNVNAITASGRVIVE